MSSSENQSGFVETPRDSVTVVTEDDSFGSLSTTLVSPTTTTTTTNANSNRSSFLQQSIISTSIHNTICRATECPNSSGSYSSRPLTVVASSPALILALTPTTFTTTKPTSCTPTTPTTTCLIGTTESQSIPTTTATPTPSTLCGEDDAEETFQFIYSQDQDNTDYLLMEEEVFNKVTVRVRHVCNYLS